MSISTPPNDSQVIRSDGFFESAWMTWLQAVWRNGFAWTRTSFIEHNSSTVLNVGAQTSLTVNFTVPGARVAGTTKDVLVTYPYTDYGDGIVWSAAITASDTATLRIHNYTGAAKNVTVGTVRFVLMQQ